MLVVLQAKSNGARVQRLQLRANQVARIGRSEWADFSFSDDADMSDVQFELRSTDEACIVRTLSPNTPTFVNGQEIQTATVHHGDRIKAGRTEFVVHIEGERTPTPAETKTQPGESPVAARTAVASLVATCALLEFHEDITAKAAKTPSADALIDELAQQEKFLDALRLRAYLLSKRQAVWWGCLCMRDELNAPLRPPQSAAVKAAAIWVSNPDEENRRLAEQQAAAAKYSGPGAALALSAFWSGGSIAPPENPEVLPDERLTSQGVASALIAAAYIGDPTKANPRLHAFLDKGKEIAQEKIKLPDGDIDWNAR
jgi:hypothetical protein